MTTKFSAVTNAILKFVPEEEVITCFRISRFLGSFYMFYEHYMSISHMALIVAIVHIPRFLGSFYMFYHYEHYMSISHMVLIVAIIH